MYNYIYVCVCVCRGTPSSSSLSASRAFLAAAFLPFLPFAFPSSLPNATCWASGLSFLFSRIELFGFRGFWVSGVGLHLSVVGCQSFGFRG